MTRFSVALRRNVVAPSGGKSVRLMTAAMVLFAAVGVGDSALASPDPADASGPTTVNWTVATSEAQVPGTRWLLTNGDVTFAVSDNGTVGDAVEPGVVAAADEDNAVGALAISTLLPGNWELALAEAPADVIRPSEPRRFAVAASQALSTSARSHLRRCPPTPSRLSRVPLRPATRARPNPRRLRPSTRARRTRAACARSERRTSGQLCSRCPSRCPTGCSAPSDADEERGADSHARSG